MTKDLVSDIEKRLARAVREASRNVCGEPLVSVSVGSAFFPTDGLSVEDLLSEAGPQHVREQRKALSKLQNVS